MEPTADSTSSTDASGADAPDVVVARVLGSHGLRGQLRVRPIGDAADVARACEHVSLARDENDPAPTAFRVREVLAGARGELRVALEGVEDRDAADALRGRLVLVPAAALAPLGEGEYYHHELIGCRVEDLGGRTLGHVREIWETGAPALLVITDAESGRECLVPTAAEILREVDIAARRIVVDAPPGLLDPPEGAGE